VLWVSLKDLGTGSLRLSVGGHLDASTTHRIEPMLDSILVREPWRATVDLSRLELIDTVGMGRIVGLCKRLKGRGCLVTIRGLRDQPLAIFRALGFDRRLGCEAPD
jgi:anti-anti-sigma factor